MPADRGDAGKAGASPLANRICDGVVVWFAVWTVCTHVTVALGGSLDQLIAGFAVTGVATAVALARWPGSRPAPELPEPEGRSRLLSFLPLLFAAAGLGLVATANTSGEAATLWWSAMGLLGGAAVIFLLLEAPLFRPAARGRGLERWLWALALGCLVLAVTVHRPDIDDAFYVNVAVAAADAPDEPLFDHDTMLGVETLPLHQPAHRIHTYELWNGLVARVTGIPAIYVFHWLAAGFFALMLPLAYARLFRLLTPAIWPWSVSVLILVLLGIGDTHRWHGNFSLARIWQGKAIYLCVFLPLIQAYALRFALGPTLPRFALLFAAQTAAVGVSSSAVWAAPVASLTALCAVLRPNRQGFQGLLLGALASAYVIGVGLTLKGDMQGLTAQAIDVQAFGNRLGFALSETLGTSKLWIFGIAASFAAWCGCRRGLGQRFAIAVPFAVWAILLNPYIDAWIAGNVTGPSFWRAMWALPLPVLMTLVLVSPLSLARDTRMRIRTGFASAALVAAFLATVPAFALLSPKNGGAANTGLWLGRPGPKAPTIPYRWAAALNAAVPPGAQVVAPADVSFWIPTFHHHAHPLQSRRVYLTNHVAILGPDEVSLRQRMTRFAGGILGIPRDAADFENGLDYFAVQGVLLRNAGRIIEARAILERQGFERTLRAIDYEIWVRR